ncbi:MAG: segregation/condensation protein A [Chloroflexi bacterium]|nr:segregation/condensation protein A [Chloroflexota bacterium]
MNTTRLPGSFEYLVSTSIFEGPLDLLLELIERAELDITTLSLAKVTDQFLEHIKNLPDRNANEVSGFLVMAARLVQIKSAALLPRPPVIEKENEEDNGEALVRQLLEYKKYKTIATLLEDREKSGMRSYLRLSTPVVHFDPRVDLDDFDLDDLARMASEIFNLSNNMLPLDDVVSFSRITIREKIEIILNRLKQKQAILFSSLLEKRSRVDLVVTFLAVLELIKQNVLDVSQESTFSDILICPNAASIEKNDLEIEF